MGWCLKRKTWLRILPFFIYLHHFSSHSTWHTILLAFLKIVVFSEGILFPPNCILITSFSMLFLLPVDVIHMANGNHEGRGKCVFLTTTTKRKDTNQTQKSILCMGPFHSCPQHFPFLDNLLPQTMLHSCLPPNLQM